MFTSVKVHNIVSCQVVRAVNSHAESPLCLSVNIRLYVTEFRISKYYQEYLPAGIQTFIHRVTSEGRISVFSPLLQLATVPTFFFNQVLPLLMRLS